MPFPKDQGRAVDLTQTLLDVDVAALPTKRVAAGGPTPPPLTTAGSSGRNRVVGKLNGLQQTQKRQGRKQDDEGEAKAAELEVLPELVPEEELTEEFFQAFTQAPRGVVMYKDGKSHKMERVAGEGGEEDEEGSSPASPHTQHSNRPQLTLAASPARDAANLDSFLDDDDEEERESASSLQGKQSRSLAAESTSSSSPLSTSSCSDGPAVPLSRTLLHQWPRPLPPPASAQPPPGQSRVTFHTQRYGAFVLAYCGFTTDDEVLQAQRRARSICVIGVSKQARGKGNLGCPIKTSRTFLRHSILAVEGDAVFNELMERAEMLYGVELQRARWTSEAVQNAMSTQNRKDVAHVKEEREGEDGPHGAADRRERNAECARSSRPPKKDAHVSVVSPQELLRGVLMPSVAHHCPSKLPRVSDRFLRPNARCIALHYGLPESCLPEENEDGEAGAPPPYHQRVSLMAVISTTRIEEGEEIYVSLESYYRCLDEVAWHQQRYGSRSRSVHAAKEEEEAGEGRTDAEHNVLLHGDVYTGVKQFKRWPRGLRYYHGVGKRHSGSDVAEAAFPFTLLDLTVAPELGEKELGVVAAQFVPYATCFLYTGPAIATQKAERIFSSNVGKHRGHSSSSSDSDSGSGKEEEESDGKKGRGTSRGKAAPQARRRQQEEQKQSEPAGAVGEEVDFDMDDTYALGLGRHGVCFGQGVARYINHRYNMSRYGNVELCSVMLAVPSEFSSLKRREAGTGARRRRRCVRHSTRQSGGGNSSSGSPTEAMVAVLRTRAKDEAVPCVPANGNACSATAEMQVVLAGNSNGGGGGGGGGGKRRRAPPRRNRVMFFEDESHFITVPFFITTTDIEAGTPLLAWTYGEEYDAKLERVAVADGAVVPYADAELLNARCMMGEQEEEGERSETAQDSPSADHHTPPPGVPSVHLTAGSTRPIRRWQRYGGDYRFALGVGDIVWRRRPISATAAAAAEGLDASPVSSAYTACQCGACRCLCPPPENDLFVVVQLMRDSAERVLLLPLERISMSEAALHALLKSQHLTGYTSPFAPTEARGRHSEKGTRDGRPEPPLVNAQKDKSKAVDTEDEVAVILGAKLYSRTASGANSLAPSATTTPIPPRRREQRDDGTGQYPIGRAAPPHPKHALREEWAVFDTNLALLPALTDPHRLLCRCVVATTDSLALLLPDLDYVAVRETDDGAAGSAGTSVPHHHHHHGGGGTSGSSSSSPGDASTRRRQIVCNLDDLHHNTLLVRGSHRVCAVPPMPHGLLWPTLRRQAGGIGSDWMYATEKRKELR